MKKQMKAVLCLLLAVLVTVPFACFAFSAGTTASLYGIYGNGMLLKQNSSAVFAGTAKSGSNISCTIADRNGKTVSAGQATAGKDGTFSIPVKTPKGGYAEYTVTLSENGVLFAKLKNVVFGELWLAVGQSNMSIQLSSDLLGERMKENGSVFSSWLRFLQTPANPKYNGSGSNVPFQPQENITGCKWVKGSDMNVYNSSAVAFYFAERLQQTLDVPVGIVQSSLGSSSIAAWLPRDAVDADDQVKSILKKNGTYIEKADWNESDVNRYNTMSACYNKKIAPLKNLRFSGMIWYQGENEVVYNRGYGDYTKQFNLLQQSYSELFGCDKVLPIVFTQLVSHGYADDFRLQNFNIELSEIQQALPGARAMVSVYDLPLTYNKEYRSIHPLEKEEIGERMAFCAEGLVYKKHTSCTAATVEKVTFDRSDVTIRLKNTGDGLMSDGKTLKGFAVCGQDGVYLEAEARIAADDTVIVRCENISNPCSVSYAVTQYNGRSNLFAVTDDMFLPVSPFITDKTVSTHLWKDNGWTDCETDTIWRTHKSGLAAFYQTWTADYASVGVTKDSAYSGDCGLSVKSECGHFTVSPVMTDKNGAVFFDIDKSMRGYKTMSFRVRNNGGEDVDFVGLTVRFSGKNGKPALSGSGEETEVSRLKTGCVIPADGRWHTVSLDLTKIMTEVDGLLDNGNADKLEEVSGLAFEFSCEQTQNIDLSLDSFGFSTYRKRSVSEALSRFIKRVKDFFRKLFRFQ